MKELVGKLTALDPEAGDALKVISYFDTLMDGHVTSETLLRGAAILSGTTAGLRRGARVTRILSDGSRGPDSDVTGFTSVPSGPEAVVWLERTGRPHANDAMIRERLAIAIAQSATRGHEHSSERQAVERLLATPLSDAQRLAAEAHLRLDPLSRVRAVALPSGTGPSSHFSSTILATPWGIVRGAIVHARADSFPTRAGVGVAGTIGELSGSWRTALIALALSNGDGTPSYADDLGVLVTLAEVVFDSSELPPDISVIEAALDHSWTTRGLQAIADGKSIRAVAAVVGLHHSSVHARVPELVRLLGYDPFTPLGRSRLYAGLLIRRVAQARFEV